MNVTEISIDGVEPITLDEAKQQCYIPLTDYDSTTEALLNSFIKGARKYGEGVTWRSLVDKTLELRMDEFPSNIIELPYGPVASVSSVKYILGSEEKTVDSGDYTVDINSTPARIEPINFWPNTDDVISAVRIQYKTGYQDTEVANDDNTSNVPEDIKIALRMMIKFLFDNRDSHVWVDRRGEYQEAPIGTNLILESHSLRKFV